jgi:hypothetical protein
LNKSFLLSRWSRRFNRSEIHVGRKKSSQAASFSLSSFTASGLLLFMGRAKGLRGERHSTTFSAKQSSFLPPPAHVGGIFPLVNSPA